MTLLSSLRSRIFLTSALLAVVTNGVAVYVVSVRVTREFEAALQREIDATGRLVEQLRTSRSQSFTMMARLIADAPMLKAAVDTDDPRTVQDIADSYQHQVESNLLLVTNKSGHVLATVGAPTRSALLAASEPAIGAAIAGRESVSLIPQPDGILQLVTVPVTIGLAQPDLLGTLSVGFLFDRALATQLKDMTGSEIAFAMDGEILATTLSEADRPALAPLLRGVTTTTNVMLHAEEFVALPLRLAADGRAADGGPVAVILRSRSEHLRFVRAIRDELVLIAVFAVLLATLLSFQVARTITRPLAAITDVMRAVAATGDLTRKIVLRGGRRWDDEDARLLAATFNSLTDSVGRFQREIAQKERLSSLGRLSTVIAHEVRNPLMIIKAALHTLRQPDVGPATVREIAADIDGEVVRLNRIVNDVLDFARPIRFVRAPADINALCRQSAEAAQASPGAPVQLDLAPTLPLVDTDAERLRVALVNLIVNARHAVEAAATCAVAVAAGGRTIPDGTLNPAGAAGPRVFLSTRATAGGVSIAIADTGVGIEQADLSRVFDPYFTTKRGGTGLGLPIAKNIIEGLGGAISVASAPGRGTEIRFELPVSPSS
jgi:signal transduction histidine kinase